MQIRTMIDSDLSKVARLEQITFSHPWSEESLEEALHRQDTIYLVACVDEQLAGYCGFWISYESADLCNIIVDEAYRGQGIAGALYEHAKQECQRRGVERILLEVRPSNAAAISMYQKKGFLEISRRKNYYSKPTEDAIIMEKLLP